MARRNWKQCIMCRKKISVRVAGAKCYVCAKKETKK